MIKGRDIIFYLSFKYDGNWDKIYNAIRKKEIVQEEEVLQAESGLNSKFVTIVDKEYPEALKRIYKPPFVLYYHGDLNLISDYDNILAVVGSRKCSEYSELNCRKIIKELDGKLIISSGLAIGIDGIAHRAAIDSNGKTVAVLGCGINYVYPKTNAALYEEIKKDHLIISEFPEQVKPEPDNFPFRNRIIVGLANGVFVPEVKENSGTMVSVAHAISQNRDVYIMPQPINSKTYNNSLIKEGACLVESGHDILADKNLIS